MGDHNDLSFLTQQTQCLEQYFGILMNFDGFGIMDGEILCFVGLKIMEIMLFGTFLKVVNE